MAGNPLDVEADVLQVRPDHSFQQADGTKTQVGDLALIRVEGIEIALASERAVALHADHFRSLGIPPEERKVLVVKSTGNHYAGYLDVAADYLYAGGPGATSSDVFSNGYKKMNRPKWPLDTNPFANMN